MSHSHAWQVGAGPWEGGAQVPHRVGLSTEPPDSLYDDVAAGFQQTEQLKSQDQGGNSSVFYDRVSEITWS